jgi:hypothetical protein
VQPAKGAIEAGFDPFPPGSALHPAQACHVTPTWCGITVHVDIKSLFALFLTSLVRGSPKMATQFENGCLAVLAALPDVG